jgi:hypothetical protein
MALVGLTRANSNMVQTLPEPVTVKKVPAHWDSVGELSEMGIREHDNLQVRVDMTQAFSRYKSVMREYYRQAKFHLNRRPGERFENPEEIIKLIEERLGFAIPAFVGRASNAHAAELSLKDKGLVDLGRALRDALDFAKALGIYERFHFIKIKDISLSPTYWNKGIRFSSCKFSPQWLRQCITPSDPDFHFLYFDVCAAEFANLVTYYDTQYKEVHKRQNIYKYINEQLCLSVDYSQVKMMSLALMSGGTYKAVMYLLDCNEEYAHKKVTEFWNLFPSTHDHLVHFKWFHENDTDIPLARYENEYVHIMGDTDFDGNEDDAKRIARIRARFMQESFACLFVHYLKQILPRFRGIEASIPVHLWIDSVLIAIPKYIGVSIKDTLTHADLPDGACLKLKFGMGSTWAIAEERSAVTTNQVFIE